MDVFTDMDCLPVVCSSFCVLRFLMFFFCFFLLLSQSFVRTLSEINTDDDYSCLHVLFSTSALLRPINLIFLTFLLSQSQLVETRDYSIMTDLYYHPFMVDK